MNPTDILAQAGIPCGQLLKEDGRLHRYGTKDDRPETPCWYVFHQLPNQTVAGAYGCWKRQIKQRFCSRDRQSMSASEWVEVCKAQKAAEDQHRLEQEEHQSKARVICQELFRHSPKQIHHAYLKKKGVQSFGRLTVSNLERYPEWLAVPLQDDKGVIHSAQFIAEDGTKSFLFGGRMQGCWFLLSDQAQGPLVICEGYATGASIHAATGWATVCAMTCGNLSSVGLAMRKLYPTRTILFAADNDQFTEGNPGLTKANEAAKRCKALVACPQFADESLNLKPTDYNDLHQIAGISEVKRSLIEAAKLGGDWLFLVEDARSTMDEVIPAPIEIVEGLVCEQAKMVIGGSSKSYKTWFSMALSMAISVGARFLGRQCAKKRVLYVNLELKASTFKRRLQTIREAAGFQFDYQEFFHLHLKGRIAGLSTVQVMDRIIAVAKANKVEVIVLDPLYKLNTQGTDENSAGEQGKFLNEIDRLLMETGATIIFDDHFSKGNQSEKDPLDAIRGSSVKGGDVDAALIIRHHKEKGSYVVSVVHRELPPVDDFVITWDYPMFKLNDDLDPADFKKAKGGRPNTVNPLSLLAVLAKTTAENPMTASDISEMTKIPAESLRSRHLKELRDKGWIATADERGKPRGSYITPKGAALLNQISKNQ